MQEVKREIFLNGKSMGIFVGVLVREGLGENTLHQPCRELKMRGVWEGKTQEMEITFCTPICTWKVVEEPYHGFRMV